jgi:hypothetical protein
LNPLTTHWGFQYWFSHSPAASPVPFSFSVWTSCSILTCLMVGYLVFALINSNENKYAGSEVWYFSSGHLWNYSLTRLIFPRKFRAPSKAQPTEYFKVSASMSHCFCICFFPLSPNTQTFPDISYIIYKI